MPLQTGEHDGVVIVCARGIPEPHEFAAAMERLRKPTVTALFVHAEEDGLHARQRAQIAGVCVRGGFPIAVVTDSRLARGSAKAVGWLGAKIQAFELTEARQAFLSLGISVAEVPAYLAAYRALLRLHD